MKYKKIFCLEGEWNEKDLRDKSSVESYLRFLDESFGVDYIFRKVNSKESFLNYLNILSKYSKSKYADYGILYLAFHGEKNCIYLNDGETITMEEILNECGAALKDRIVHFGSCSTLRVHADLLSDFFSKSEAKAVSGFSKDIDFMESSLFDIAYLNKLTEYERTGHILNHMWDKYPRLSEELGFVYIDNN